MDLDVNAFMAPFIVAVTAVSVCSIGLGIIRGVMRSVTEPEDD